MYRMLGNGTWDIAGLSSTWEKWVQEPDPPGWGASKIETIRDSDLRKTSLAMPGKNWKLQTRLIVREGAPRQQTRNCLQIIKERKGKIGRGSRMGAWH
jgi:hypothetical protein